MSPDEIKKLQHLLNFVGYNAGLLDGVLGPKTLSAAAAYLHVEHGDTFVATRALNRLTVDAVVDLIEGIDVSGHQGKVDWKKVAAAGCNFAWVKATEGTTHKQRTMQRNLEGARAWQIPVGVYHYGRPNTYRSLKLVDAKKEAENMLSHYGTPQPDDLVPVLDMESGYIKTEHDYNVDWTLEFCRVVEEGLGCKPMLYTARWAIQSRLEKAANVEELAKYKLWWAEYRSATTKAPRKKMLPWKGYTVWQWTGSGSIAGVKGRVDRNRMKPKDLEGLKISS